MAGSAYATDPITTAYANGGSYTFGTWAAAPVSITFACVGEPKQQVYGGAEFWEINPRCRLE